MRNSQKGDAWTSGRAPAAAKGCGFTAAFPLIFVVLILLVVILSKLFSAGSGG